MPNAAPLTPAADASWMHLFLCAWSIPVRRGHPATPPAACDEFAGRHRRARAKLMTARLPRSYPSREMSGSLAGSLTTLISCWSFSALTTRCGRSLAVYAVIAR